MPNAPSFLWRFYRPRDVLSDLRQVNEHLLDPRAPNGQRSYGEVTTHQGTSLQSGAPVPGGILCQEIFGPVGSGLRSLRWGHVEVPLLLHPLAVPQVARALGFDIGRVLRIARWIESLSPSAGDQSGSRGPSALLGAIQRAGGATCEAAFVRRVPIPPANARRANAPRWAHTHWDGGCNAALEVFVRLARYVAYRDGPDPPAPLRSSWLLRAELQLAFERVVMAMQAPDAAPARLYSFHPRASHELIKPEAWRRVPRDARAAVVWADKHHIAVRSRHKTCIVTKGQRAMRIDCPLRPLYAKRRELVLGVGTRATPVRWWTDAGGDELVVPAAVWDLRTRRWRRRCPDWAPSVELQDGRGRGSHQERVVAAGACSPEAIPLTTDASFGLPLDYGGDEPRVLARTADGYWAWIGPAPQVVIEVETGVPAAVFEPAAADVADDRSPEEKLLDALFGAPAPMPARPPALRLPSPAPSGTRRGVFALGRTRAGRFRFYEDGRVHDGAETLFRLPHPIRAAAFDHGARRLAVLVGDAVHVIDIARARWLWRASVG